MIRKIRKYLGIDPLKFTKLDKWILAILLLLSLGGLLWT